MGGDGQHRIATPKRVGTKLLRSRIGHPMTIDHQAILVLPGTEPGIADPSAVAIPVECVLLRIPVIEGTGHRDGQRGRILEFEADRNRPETGFGSGGGGGVPVFGDGAVGGVFQWGVERRGDLPDSPLGDRPSGGTIVAPQDGRRHELKTRCPLRKPPGDRPVESRTWTAGLGRQAALRPMEERSAMAGVPARPPVATSRPGAGATARGRSVPTAPPPARCRLRPTRSGGRGRIGRWPRRGG